MKLLATEDGLITTPQRSVWKLVAAWLCFFLASLPVVRAGVALRFYYRDIPGTTVADLTNHPSFPQYPNSVEAVTDGLEKIADRGEQFGTWTRGYLQAPKTGNYTFLMASDDASEFWLSTNYLVSGLEKVAVNPSYVTLRNYAVHPGQQSVPIPLEQGQDYYFELRHKEGTVVNHVTVAWKLPDGTIESPIPATCLLPFPIDQAHQPRAEVAPHILSDYFGMPVTALTNVAVEEGNAATFAVTVEATPPVYFQWLRNQIPVPGANLATYTVAQASLTNDVDLYSVVISNQWGKTQGEAVLSVFANKTKPEIKSTLLLEKGKALAVFFSKRINPAMGAEAHDYLVNGEEPSQATLLRPDAVLLQTKGAGWSANSQLVVRQIQDLAQFPNTIDPAPVAITRDLKAWFTFDQMNGSNVVDLSRLNRPGILLTNVTFLHGGKSGGGVSFDGPGACVKLGNGMSDFLGGLTISVWDRPTAVKSWARLIDFSNGTANDNIILGRFADSNDLFFEIYRGNVTTGKVVAASALELNQWQHFVVTMSSVGETSLYKNGALIMRGIMPLPRVVSRTNNVMARSPWPAGVDDDYRGEMDALRVYDRALSAEEIKILAKEFDHATN